LNLEVTERFPWTASAVFCGAGADFAKLRFCRRGRVERAGEIPSPEAKQAIA
jgi:hypothetical protein